MYGNGGAGYIQPGFTVLVHAEEGLSKQLPVRPAPCHPFHTWSSAHGALLTWELLSPPPSMGKPRHSPAQPLVTLGQGPRWGLMPVPALTSEQHCP